jgi:hypothetical protein
MNSIDDLPLDHCAFELRYNPAYHLWDHVGSIWSAMVAAHPGLKATATQPNQQTFETDTLKLSLEISALRVLGRGEHAVDEVAKKGRLLTQLACEGGKIDSFKRAGFRMIRIKSFESSAEALQFAGISNEGLANLGKKSQKVGCGHSTRYEGENSGLQVTLRIEERELNFQAPWESLPFLPPKLERKEPILISDCDYYTIGIVEQESFDPETWVRQALKTIDTHWGISKP